MSKTIINSKIVTLNGISTKVEFNETFKNFAVNNHGEDNIYVSMSPISDISNDGVSAILPYDSVCTLHGSDEDTVYLYGTGEAEVRGTESGINPFKNSLRGGEKALKESISGIEENVSDIQGYIGYTDSDILGLEADFENNRFTRLAGAIGKSGGSDFDIYPMYGGRRRCNVLDDGTITAYCGDNNYNEDGSNGQVMVYQPKFYYKVVPLKLEPITDGIGYHLRKARYYISASPKSGFKLHPAFYGENGEPVEYILFSAYEGSIYDVSAGASLANDEQVADFTAGTGDKLSSIAGVKPCSGAVQNLTRANAEQLAKNRGAGWHIDTIKSVSANQLLMIIEYFGFNTQALIAKGVTNKPIGTANESEMTGNTHLLANSTGMADGDPGFVSVSYRGMENQWGNIWKYIHGLNIHGDGSLKGGIPYICDDYAFNENKNNDNYKSAGFTVLNTAGYISAFGYSKNNDWLFIPSQASGNNNIPIGDYAWATPHLNGYRILLLGGAWYHSDNAGGFCYYMDCGTEFKSHHTGSRLLHIPAK